MAARPTLPYYAPAELLPAPLPTVAEILASKRRLSSRHLAPVFLIGEHYAVKYGYRTSTQEGENMLFVQQSTSIPVPKVYAIFQEDLPEDGVTYKVTFIVMEYIPGQTLAHAWGALSASAKGDIIAQLRRHLDELRSIPSPGFYGGIWRQQLCDVDFESRDDGLIYPEPEISGPHETEGQFVEAMWRCLDKVFSTDYEGGPVMRERVLAYWRRHYHIVFKGHPPVFTHGNLFPGNVMVRPDRSVVIIDWERAGWYPTFWEYCGTLMLLDHRSDWDDLVYDMFADQYEAEMGWFAHHRDMILHTV